jgi:hypothetical protein
VKRRTPGGPPSDDADWRTVKWVGFALCVLLVVLALATRDAEVPSLPELPHK